MIYYFKYKALKKQLELIEKEGVEDFLVNEMTYRNGNFEADFESKTFTRIISSWAYESLKQYGAENYLSIVFGMAGKEKYKLTVKRENGLSPEEKMKTMELEIERLKSLLEEK